MNKEQIEELIQEYESKYTSGASDFPVCSERFDVNLQDGIKDNFWYLFSGRYDIFLFRSLRQMFSHSLAEILKNIIFFDKFEDMPLYLNVDLKIVEELYRKHLHQERGKMVIDSLARIEIDMIETTAKWRLKHSINKKSPNTKEN